MHFVGEGGLQGDGERVYYEESENRETNTRHTPEFQSLLLIFKRARAGLSPVVSQSPRPQSSLSLLLIVSLRNKTASLCTDVPSSLSFLFFFFFQGGGTAVHRPRDRRKKRIAKRLCVTNVTGL